MAASPSYVVAVSGTSGSGKSALIEEVARRMGGATCLRFDDYVTLGSDPEAIAAWVKSGVDPDWVKTPELAEDLRRHDAKGGLILLEEPFGRARAEVAGLVDWAAHLDVPLDVALARRMLRASVAADALSDMIAQLRAFLAGGREIYRAVDGLAAAVADRILDGNRPTLELAELLADDIKRRIPS